MADAPEEEQDIQLQKSADKLIAELQAALHPFLWKATKDEKSRIRRQVRVRDTDSLVALLEPFQELPQLLDPHLNTFVPLLAQAFLGSLLAKRPVTTPAHSQLLMPISRAICRLLYIFCKIRGEKVIVRFLSTETRHLELLLAAIEDGRELGLENKQPWQWEERYITLLWLSQLFLAPFDLASISSSGTEDASPVISGLTWPDNVPGVTLRVVPLAIQYLSSSGKERDAAKVLLVRVATRRDMHELGVLDALMKWATSRLRRPSSDSQSTYYYIGILSFLAGALVSSASTADMDPYLPTILSVVQNISAADNATLNALNASAVARKTIIKVFRTISVLFLRRPNNMASAEMVELTIDHMLESLKDPATPVRLAASKGLGVITLKLAPDMAEQVVEAVLYALQQKVLPGKASAVTGNHPDLSAVEPLEWHGLILTLSHLLYRRSPPATSLPKILAALITGLSFEQRSSSGNSIGTNVRDAANFGIWAVARRYTTAELQAMTPTNIGGTEQPAALQMLATALVVAASLDPAGNIRRGSSAALQELIGRHPDTVAEGIRIVQVVDYHAVARRSRAVQEISLQAAQLSGYYLDALLEACFGWRGVGDGDVSARRAVAEAFGSLVWTWMVPNRNWPNLRHIISRIERQIRVVMKHQVAELHGLLLCLSSVLRHLGYGFTQDELLAEISNPVGLRSTVQTCKTLVANLLELANENWFTYRRPELTAEAVAQLLVVAYPVLKVDAIFSTLDILQLQSSGEQSDIDLLGLLNTPVLNAGSSHGSTNSVNVLYENGSGRDKTVKKLMLEVLDTRLLSRNECEVFQPARLAGLNHVLALDKEQQLNVIDSWDYNVSLVRGGHGFIYAVFQVYPLLPTAQENIGKAIRRRWTGSPGDIETKRAILACLSTSVTAINFVDLVEQGIDDYTTNARGDVGSLLRIEAAKAAGVICKSNKSDSSKLELFKRLFGKVLRLAAEKLDKVRTEGQSAVAGVLDQSQAAIFQQYSTSSTPYFAFLLNLTNPKGPLAQQYDSMWLMEMMQGFITSADTGSEELVRASRAALVEFCYNDANQHAVSTNLKEMMKISIGNDRILVPTMEIMCFLFDYAIFKEDFDLGSLFILAQRAHYKTGNVRKLEAAVKIYGCLAVCQYAKATDKLTSLLLHPIPLIRNQAADTLFSVTGGLGKGVNWVTAKKADVETLRKALAAA